MVQVWCKGHQLPKQTQNPNTACSCQHDTAPFRTQFGGHKCMQESLQGPPLNRSQKSTCHARSLARQHYSEHSLLPQVFATPKIKMPRTGPQDTAPLSTQACVTRVWKIFCKVH